MLIKNKNQGFALTEVILAVVIMLIVTIGGIAAYRNMVQKNEEQKIENRVTESIRTAQKIRLHMVDYLTDSAGVQRLVDASNRQLAKDFSYLAVADIPVVSSGANSGNFGILRVAVPVTYTQTCLGVGGHFLWNSTNAYKGVTVSGTNGNDAKAGIIDYTQTISSIPADGNFAPFSFVGNANATVSRLNQACLQGATLYVYF